jgi:sugar lactone lactonase YvrE
LFEPLEDRRLLSVNLYGVVGENVLYLSEDTPGATPAVVISEPSPNQLKIDLGAGHTFGVLSLTSADLTYQNAGSPATSQFVTIDISQRDTISALEATLPGDQLVLGPISDLVGGLGSITASAAGIEVTGINTASAGGNVDLSATGNLTVDPGAIIQTGTGAISLAADVNADGTGDDGVGTLSIGAGAFVASSDTLAGAITLRGAAININTGANPAFVGVDPASMTPTAGGVVVRASLPTLPISVGNAAVPVAGINLTSAELAQIQTTGTGTIAFGDGSQTGDITFTTATPATTPGAATVVVQDAAGPGQIVLDDAGSGTALDGNRGDVSLYAGTGGIVAASANNSAAEIATMGSSVTLAADGPIGAASNRIQLADNPDATRQNVIVSDDSGGGVYLDGLGSLTLGDIESGGPIDVTARRDLTVAPGATIDSGASTLCLGADLNADGTGYGGLGALFIDAGTTVTSSDSAANAITLRGADVHIDTSANPAVVGATPQDSAPTATFGGSTPPSAIAFDSAGTMYVANSGNNTVSEFDPNDTTPATTLAGFDQPSALAFDSSGDLFVLNSGNSTVTKISAQGTATTLSGLDAVGSGPQAMAVDPFGDVFVVNNSDSEVSEFYAGQTSPDTTLLTADGAMALAIDGQGNVYVLNGAGEVQEFAYGSSTPNLTASGAYDANALAVDSQGNLYVAGNYPGINKYAPGATTPTATLSAASLPAGSVSAMAVDAQGNLFVANWFDGVDFEVLQGCDAPVATFGGPAESVAMALDSSGNLYVANQSDDTVREFSPRSTAVPASPSAGGVVIRSADPAQPISVGGGQAVDGINLTSAELAQILTVPGGTVTIGDSSQTGDITITSATPATTPGAATVVVQDPSGPGRIVLDDAGSGTALDGNQGDVSLTPGSGVVVTPLSALGTPLATQGFNATGLTLVPTLAFAPAIGAQLTVIDNTAAPAASNPITGAFANLPQGSTFTADFGGETYTFRANYAGGDGNDLVLTAISVAKSTSSITAPKVVALDPSGPYTGSPFTGSATVTGHSGVAATSLEGISPTLSYYAGAKASGTPLAAAPSTVGTYTVVATFAGSLDYQPTQSAPLTFHILQAVPGMKLVDASGPYTGAAFAATLVLTDAGGAQVANLEGISPTLSYYAGGKLQPGAPSAPGAYTVVATFAGSADYARTQTKAVAFTIAKAVPLMSVTDAAGTFSGAQFPPATVTVTGLDGIAAQSLEGFTPSVKYYSDPSGSSALPYGTGLTAPPSKAGTYAAFAYFPGSADYAATTSAPAIFTIGKATPTLTLATAGGPFNSQYYYSGPISGGPITTATIAGVVPGVDTTPKTSLENVGLVFTFYAGGSAAGAPLPYAPTHAGTYTVALSFKGSADYAAALTTQTFTITKATPSLTLAAAGRPYNAQPFYATATIFGVPGINTTSKTSLENVGLVFTYYAGGSAAGAPLQGAPTHAGTYAVVVSFAGSADYAAAQSSQTFTITTPTPAITIVDAGGWYNGSPFTATASMKVGSGAAVTSLESVPLTLTYYAGNAASGTPLSGAPFLPGYYTVLASFAGSADYAPAENTRGFQINAVGHTTSDGSYWFLGPSKVNPAGDFEIYRYLSTTNSTIDTGGNATALGTTTVNTVYAMNSVNQVFAYYAGWIQLSSVTASDGSVWFVDPYHWMTNAGGLISRFHQGTLQSGGWYGTHVGFVQGLSQLNYGRVVCVSSQNQFYFWNGSGFVYSPLTSWNIWYLDTTTTVDGNHPIYRYSNGAATAIGGAALAIGTDANGNVWIDNSINQVYVWYNNSGWKAEASVAPADGSVWFLDPENAYDAANDLYAYRFSNGQLTQMPGAGVQLMIANNGDLALQNAAHDTYRWDGSGWDQTSAAEVLIENLPDHQLATLVQSDYNDGSMSRTDMIGIFQAVISEGPTVSAADFQALKSIVSGLSMPGYVRVLSSDVVNGNLANAWYLGLALGNLSAGDTTADLTKLVDKWFYGDDLPALTGYSGLTYQSANGTLYGKQAAPDSTGSFYYPVYTDERQSQVGDCYLLSTLGSIARTSPATIENMFIPNGDGTWTVRFFANGVADYVTVNSQLPCAALSTGFQPGFDQPGGTSVTDASNVLWMALAEKAYAQWNETGKEGRDGHNEYSSISGGGPENVAAQVTGYSAQVIPVNSSATTESSLIAALQNDDAVEFNSQTTNTNGNGYNGTVAPDHDYSGLSYDATTGCFILYNPWGPPAPGAPQTQPNPQSFADLIANFDYFVIDSFAPTFSLTNYHSNIAFALSGVTLAASAASTPLSLSATPQGDPLGPQWQPAATAPASPAALDPASGGAANVLDSIYSGLGQAPSREEAPSRIVTTTKISPLSRDMLFHRVGANQGASLLSSNLSFFVGPENS